MRQAEFNDPRLVSVYDAEALWDFSDDYFCAVVDGAFRVLDLGCGTGRLALGLAAAGHLVTGVDPARASLDAARAKPGAEAVRWIEGTSTVLPTDAFDAAVLTSHVAQFLVDDLDWLSTLGDLHRALGPGGRLAFDARNPRDRAWLRWNPRDSRRLLALPDGSAVEVWSEVDRELDGVVDFAMHYRFSDGTTACSTAMLRFRTEEQLRDTLTSSGFSVEQVYGGWGREPVGHADGELLVVAVRR
jgi:SAM-dependent methyltransferase